MARVQHTEGFTEAVLGVVANWRGLGPETLEAAVAAVGDAVSATITADSVVVAPPVQGAIDVQAALSALDTNKLDDTPAALKASTAIWAGTVASRLDVKLGSWLAEMDYGGATPGALVADLASHPGTQDGQRIVCSGKAARRDLGGGIFEWAAGSSATVDGNMVVAATGGRWFRIWDGHSVNVRWFGALGDGTTDDSAAFQAAVDFGARRVVVPGGTFLLASMVSITAGHELVIDGGGYNYVARTGSVIKVPANGIGVKITASQTHVQNLLFSGWDTAATPDAVGGVGLWVGACNAPQLSNVMFTGFSFAGLCLDGAQNMALVGLKAQYNMLAVFITNGTRNISFYASQIGNFATLDPAALVAARPNNRGIFVGRYAYDATGATSRNKYIPQLADTATANYPSAIQFFGGLSERYINDDCNVEINGFWDRISFYDFELTDAKSGGFLLKTSQVYSGAVGEVMVHNPDFGTNLAGGSRPGIVSAHDRGQVFVTGRIRSGFTTPLVGKNVFWGFSANDRPPYHSVLGVSAAFGDGIGNWVVQPASTTSTVAYDSANRLLSVVLQSTAFGVQTNAVSIYAVTGSDWASRAGTALRVEGICTALSAAVDVYALGTVSPFQRKLGTIRSPGRFRFDVDLAVNDNLGIRLLPSAGTLVSASFAEVFVGIAVDESHGNPALPRPDQAPEGMVFDVRRYGAQLDGVTDDSAAVKACFDAVIAVTRANTYAPWRNNSSNRHGEASVYFPAGVCRIVNPAVMDTSTAIQISEGLLVRGEGPSSEIFFDPTEATESRTIVSVTDVHTVLLDPGASAVDGFYVGCRFFTTTKAASTNVTQAICIAYVGSTRTATFGTDFSPILTTSNTFTVYGVPQTGTLSAATSTTLSFVSTDSFVAGATLNSLKGRRVRLVSGTGTGQECVIASNAAPSGGLVVATLGRALAVVPDNTTGYWANGSVLLMNTRHHNLRFEQLSFVTGAARCLWYWSDRSTSFGINRMAGRDLNWTGFSKGLELGNSGNNNNDQHTFTNCKVTSGIVECFKHLLDSDQELGFDFNQFFYFGSWGPLVRADKGGNIHIRNLDTANWARNVVANTYLFELNNPNTAAGVQNFAVAGMRSEVINTNGFTKILKCAWKSGVVTFTNVDLENQASFFSYNQTMFYFNISNSPGPQTTFRNCKMVGKLEIEYNTSGTTQEGAFSFEDCGWYDQTTWIPVTPEEVVTYTKTGAHANRGAAPAVRFRNCRKVAGRTGNARYVWDYVVGWSTQRYAKHGEGLVTVGEYQYGQPATGGTVNTTYFPIGDVVTGFVLWAPAQADGGSAEANAATYILKTEAGTEICRTTVANPSLGFYVTVAPTNGWWHCKDDASRRLVIAPDTDVSTLNIGLVPMIRYLGAP